MYINISQDEKKLRNEKVTTVECISKCVTHSEFVSDDLFCNLLVKFKKKLNLCMQTLKF